MRVNLHDDGAARGDRGAALAAMVFGGQGIEWQTAMAILGGTLFMVERDYDFGESIVYGVGSGFGGAGARMYIGADAAG